MSSPPGSAILTINSGSSSVKAALYRGEELLLRALMDCIGLDGGSAELTDAGGRTLEQRQGRFPDHGAALTLLFDWVKAHARGDLAGVGHRVVHGGHHFQAPQRVTSDLIAELHRLAPFDPLHLPPEITGIEAVAALHAQLPQVACFDTAFHATMPEVARTLPMPRRLADEGIRRYGFHGLSYEYVAEELARLTGTAKGRTVIAHLGNGASMAAVLEGRCVETTMGFTPTGGLVMGTRCGDLDPGVLLYLLEARGMSPAELNRLVNRESGLLGLSGSSSDMRELLKRRSSDPAAALAVDVFCYQARKFVAALAAALGGLDTLVFTAGIGEHAAEVRRGICDGLGWLGVRLDAGRNARHEGVISADGSAVAVRVIPTNEELMIARHTARVLRVE